MFDGSAAPERGLFPRLQFPGMVGSQRAMKKSLISLVCIVAVLSATPAFAYKRDTGGVQTASGEGSAQQAPTTQAPPAPWEQDSHDDSGSSGGGMVTAGYVFLIVGGMAAIAGSTMIAASDNHRTSSAIIAGSGAALSLAGSLMIMLGGNSGYALAPSVDPSTKSFGVALAANF
jgi:hypothetical protein